MKTHVFGAKSLPCCVSYALKRTSSDNVTETDSDTLNAGCRKNYVDDLCLSCSIEQERKTA